MKNTRTYRLFCLAAAAGSLLLPLQAFAATPLLGSAETFAVLAGAAVTNTGTTQIKGNLGVSPGTAITGFPPGLMLVGTIHSADAVAAQAQADLTTAYNTLAGFPCVSQLTGTDLGGLTLTSGVYCFATTAQLTGTLVLDFQGVPGHFVFQIGSALTTASSSTVIIKNCVSNCAVEWQVGSSATLGTDTVFHGNIVALTSITLNHGAKIICGRALALNGAVTMDTNTVYFMGTLTPPGAAMVSGGGQILVPTPDSHTPGDTGLGTAAFSFIPDPKGNGTILDYMNYVSGIHVYGLVSSMDVIAANPDGSPQAISFLGACHANLPACSFSGTVQGPTPASTVSNGTPEFGIAITGAVVEERSQRPLSSGKVLLQ